MGLTQKDIAKMLNISTRTYKRIELGNMTVAELGEIAKILKFNVQIILDENTIGTFF